MKVSVSGSTSLKESEKEKFTNHGVRKTDSQQAEESQPDIWQLQNISTLSNATEV